MNLKKVLSLILANSLVFVTACSNQAEHTSLINKSLNFLEHNNSYEIIDVKRETIDMPQAEQKDYQVKITSTFTNDSFVFKQVSEGTDYKVQQYIKDGISYINNAQGEWYTDNNTEPYIETIKNIRKISTFDKNDFVIQEDNSSYTVNFKPTDMEVAERKLFSETQIDFEKTKLEEYWAILKIDKKTMKPINFESRVKANIHSKQLDENNKEINYSFTNDSTNKSDFKFDSIPTVELPKEAQGARRI